MKRLLVLLMIVLAGCESSIWADHNRKFKMCVVQTQAPLKEPRITASQTDDKGACIITAEVPKGWRCWEDSAHFYQVRNSGGYPIGFVPQPVCHKDAK